MLIPDVNILINAYRPEGAHHTLCRAWLQAALQGSERLSLIDIVLVGFLRIVTNRRAFKTPSTIAEALEFANALYTHSNCKRVGSSEAWWKHLTELSAKLNASGNLLTDLHIAAIAINQSATVVTLDKDLKNIPGLNLQLLELAPTLGGGRQSVLCNLPLC